MQDLGWEDVHPWMMEEDASRREGILLPKDYLLHAQAGYRWMKFLEMVVQVEDVGCIPGGGCTGCLVGGHWLHLKILFLGENS